MKNNRKKGISVVLATAMAVTPLVAVPKAYAIKDIKIEADDPDTDTNSEYTVEFEIEEDLKDGDKVYIKFDDKFDVSSSISDSDITLEDDDENTIDVKDNSVNVSGNVISFKVDEKVNDGTTLVVTINEDVVTNPYRDDEYNVSVRTDPEYSYKVGSIEIGNADSNNYDNGFDVYLSDDGTEDEAEIQLGEINLKDDLETGEYIYVTFPTSDMLPSSVSKSAVKVNGYKAASVSKSGSSKLKIEVPSGARGEDKLTIEFSDNSGITNPEDADDNYTFLVEYSGEEYESEEFEIQGSSSSSSSVISSNFAVTLSDSNAGARTSYNFTLDFGSKKLESGKTIEVEFPSAGILPPFMSQGSVTINGDTAQNLYVSGNRISFKTPSGFSSAKTAKVVFNYDGYLKSPATAGSYSLGVIYDYKTYRSANFTVTGQIVTPPTPVDNNTATISLSKPNPGAITGINVGIKGLGVPLTKNADFLELALPAGFRVPTLINTGAITVNGVIPSYVGVRGQNIVIYPSQDITANTAVNVVVSEAFAVGAPTIASLYNIGVYTSEEKNLLFSRPITIAAPTVPILNFKINSAIFTKQGKSYPLTTAPYTLNGNTLVPAQLLKSGLGLTTSWDKTKATVVSGKTTIVFKVNSQTVTVNGKAGTLSVAVQLKNNMPMIPLRYVADSLGYKLSWDNKTSSVVVSR